MNIKGYNIPKSSFLSVEKDTNLIINKMLENKRLLRLLKYTTEDCMSQPNISENDAIDTIGTNIRIIPKLTVDSSVLNYIIVNFDHFTPNNTNPEFRDNIIEFDIICHFDQWQLKDFQLRPYRIAAEIDSMFDEKHLSGIGHLHFLGANQMILTDEYAGLCLMYQAIHGGEDKTKMLNPNDEKQFEQDYRKMMGV